ncbi:structural protein, partial [Staphylococcus aureus]
IGIKGGDNNRYVQIQNDSIELGGIVQRTWRGKRSTDDIFTRLKDGHLRFRNNTAGGSLYMSHFGISTYIDGEGEDGGSSGTIQWWDKTYSDSGMNGIT